MVAERRDKEKHYRFARAETLVVKSPFLLMQGDEAV